MSDQPIEPFQPSQRPNELDPELRKRAVGRLKARQNFTRHLSIYLIMSVMFVVVWAASGREDFWPIWPILGWGIAIAFQALSLRNTDISEEQIASEAAKLRGPRPNAGPQDRV